MTPSTIYYIIVIQSNQLGYMGSKYNTAITIRLTPEIFDKITEVAEKSETSKASIIRQAISKLLKELE